jgi:hypothetical protein
MMEEHEMMFSSHGKTEKDGEAWLLDDPRKAETS